jgi:formylglycine-generating enzyme required for sulfatase activity
VHPVQIDRISLKPLQRGVERGGCFSHPDEVGSPPATRRPFGVDDLVANVWEWVDSSRRAHERVLRGGSYYFGRRTNLVMNREVVEPGMRDATLGVRVCASPRGS